MEFAPDPYLDPDPDPLSRKRIRIRIKMKRIRNTDVKRELVLDLDIFRMQSHLCKFGRFSFLLNLVNVLLKTALLICMVGANIFKGGTPGLWYTLA